MDMRLLQARRLSRVGDFATGFEKQEDTAARYAQEHGHEIVATADDSNVSGSKDPFERPALGPWLRDRLDEYDGIIAAKLDRLGRNARHLQELRAWAEDHGKVLIVVDPSLQWPPPEGMEGMPSRVMWELLGILAEAELAAITERNRETQATLRRQGFLVGRPPWGYRVVMKGAHKTLEPDPDLLPYLRGAIDRSLTGSTLTATCEWLDSQGAKPLGGGIWHQRSLAQLLRNQILYGRRMAANGKLELEVEPVIDYATWKRLQTALDGNARRKGAVADNPALLTSIIACAKCRRGMYHHRERKRLANGDERIYEYYRCDGTTRKPSTCKNTLRAADVDEWINGEFIGTFGDREVVERVVIPGAGHDAEVELIEADIRALDLDAPDFDARLADLRAERSRLLSLPPDPDRIEERPTGQTVREMWESLDTAGKRDYLRRASVRVYASKDEWHLEAEHPEVLWGG